MIVSIKIENGKKKKRNRNNWLICKSIPFINIFCRLDFFEAQQHLIYYKCCLRIPLLYLDFSIAAEFSYYQL